MPDRRMVVMMNAEGSVNKWGSGDDCWLLKRLLWNGVRH